MKKTKEVKELIKNVLENKENVNNLVLIIDEIESNDLNVIKIAVEGVEKIFKTFLTFHQFNFYEGKNLKKENLKSEEKVGCWLFEQYDEYLNKIQNFFLKKSSKSSEEIFQSFLNVLWDVNSNLHESRDGDLGSKEMLIILEVALKHQDLLPLILDYMKFTDFTLSLLTSLSAKISSEKVERLGHLTELFSLLKSISEKMPNEKTEIEFLLTSQHSHKQVRKWTLTNLRKKFGCVWLEYLKYQLPKPLLKKVLICLHTIIIPNFSQARLLADFLIRSYEQGGGIALLSLQGLFVLMQHHNLELPNFYKRLYGMLHPRIFEARYKSRFFFLLNLFLSSTHVPHYVIQSFIKKIARLALVAPPIGARLCLKFSLNLMKRYPGCEHLINSQKADSVENDPFDDEEEDPAKTHAAESSLWELKSLQDHYLPSVQRLCDVKFLSKKERDIGDLLDEEDDEIFNKICDKRFEEFAMIHERPLKLLGGFEDEVQSLWSL